MNDLLKVEAPKLNIKDNTSCEGKKTETEILEALKNTKNNKSPGNDGVPAEFYKVFWIDLKEYFMETINYVYENMAM